MLSIRRARHRSGISAAAADASLDRCARVQRRQMDASSRMGHAADAVRGGLQARALSRSATLGRCSYRRLSAEPCDSLTWSISLIHCRNAMALSLVGTSNCGNGDHRHRRQPKSSSSLDSVHKISDLRSSIHRETMSPVEQSVYSRLSSEASGAEPLVR